MFKKRNTEPVQADGQGAESNEVDQETLKEKHADLRVKELRTELRRVKYNQRFLATLYNTIGTLLVAAAAAVLIANFWLPVMQVTGSSL